MNNSYQSFLFLSTGRTGTKFLASILGDTVPDANASHEGGERSRLINIFSHANLAGFTPQSFTLFAWRMAISKSLNITHELGKYYIDANNQIYELVVNHPELYPGLKVVHIIRDPRDYSRSHLNWTHGRVKSLLANYLVPFWQPTGVLHGEMRLGEWFRLTKLEQFAWIWNYKNMYINQLEGSSTPYLWVRFEDLFSTTAPGLTYGKILDFLGLSDYKPADDYFQKIINASKNKRVPEWTQWPDLQCKIIDRLCRVGMEKFGYGDEPEWISKIGSNGKKP